MALNAKKQSWSICLLIFITVQMGRAYECHFQHDNKYITEGRSTIKVLDKALNYLEKHPKSIVDDVVFGVLIAKANLKWITSRLKIKKENEYLWPQDIKKLLGKCNNIMDASNKGNRFILNKNLWLQEAEDLKTNCLQQTDNFFLPKFNSCQSIDNYMMNGSPDDSDACLEELLKTNCNISDYCWFSEFNNNPHSGYKTSHRLIYLQAAKKLNCEKQNKKFLLGESEKRNLCQRMLLEAKALYKNPYFFLTRDLFMEQIALCGYEGYEEFASATWRKEIRRWQSSNGCYGKDMKFNNCSNKNKRRVKRTDLTLNKCHTHVTAVATSALAFHLRVILSKIFIL